MGKEPGKKMVAGARGTDKTIEVLLEISNALSITFNLDELYKAIHKSLGKIINVDNFFISILDQKKDSISFPYWIDEEDDVHGEIFNFSKSASLTAKVISSGKPIMFKENQLKEIAAHDVDGIIGTVPRIWLGAPLMIRNRVTGALVVQSYKNEDMYQKADLDILNLVAQHIALAIERKQADEALHNQSEILEKILETSPVGVSLVKDRVFQWVNCEMVRLFGYKGKDDFKGKSVEMIYPCLEDYKKAGDIIYCELKERGKAEVDVDLMRKDGTIFSGHIQLGSAEPSDPMAWTIATMSDISVRKNAEKERSKNEKLQVVLEMAGAVCHELNQPLQALLGYSELIMMENNDTFPYFNELEAITTQVTRIAKMTKRLAGITQYTTVDYPGNTKIVDIWSSGTDNDK